MCKRILVGALLALSGCAAPRPGGMEYPLFEPETKGPGMTDYCKAIVDFLGYEYEYFEFTMGEDIYARYEALAAQGRGEGFTPLIIIPTDTLAETFDIEFLDEIYGTGTTPQAFAAWREQAIAAAAQADAGAFFRTEQERLERVYGKSLMPALGSFVPAQPDQNKPLSGSIRPEEEAVIVKFPTGNPWELAIWVPMGGFNDCPEPLDMAVAFRHWQEQYGAVPVVLQGHDGWELELTRPPQSNDACEVLAREHLIFCFDLAGFSDSIRAYASTLRGTTTWGFWWD